MIKNLNVFFVIAFVVLLGSNFALAQKANAENFEILQENVEPKIPSKARFNSVLEDVNRHFELTEKMQISLLADRQRDTELVAFMLTKPSVVKDTGVRTWTAGINQGGIVNWLKGDRKNGIDGKQVVLIAQYHVVIADQSIVPTSSNNAFNIGGKIILLTNKIEY